MFADEKPSGSLLERYRKDDTPLYTAWADAPVEDTGTPDAEHSAMLDLRELTQPEADPGIDPANGPELSMPYYHTTGSQLRHRLVTPESISELKAREKPSLLQRLMWWK